MGYTLDQARGYAAAIARDERRRQRELLLLLRASQAKKDAFLQVLRALT